MKYRTRSLEVRALRWTGENVAEVINFTHGSTYVVHDPSSHSLFVATPEGQKRCAAGDWLVRRGESQYSTCSAEDFDATYELADVLEAA